MVIQNIHNPRVKQEISRDEWEKLDKRQKLFRILDENDSPFVKPQTISNTVKKETKSGEKKPDPKASDKKK